jgi:hypothetical protein
MYRLVYVSSATVPFSKTDLVNLLDTSRRNNMRRNVTGMLLYKDGDFLQLIEGERQQVKDLFEHIKQDPRHENTIVIDEEDTEGRIFNDWSMGFRDLSDPEVHKLPGYSQYMNTPLVAESLAKHPSVALELLSMFKPLF